MKFTQHNLLEFEGKKLPVQGGGYIVVKCEETGRGWGVCEIPPDPDAAPFRRGGIDVNEVVRLLNEKCCCAA